MIVNGQTRFHTSGNGKKKDIIYQIYGREIAGALIPVNTEKNGLRIDGYIGKPEISRGNRNLENFSINGRNIRSSILSRAVEDGYGRKMMQHQYPFAMLCLYSDPAGTDVNVHPSKMEVRFSNPQQVYADVSESVREAIAGEELIRDPFAQAPDRMTEQPAEPLKRRERPAEPFEINRIRKESAEHQYSFSDLSAGNTVRVNEPDFLRENENTVKIPERAEERLLSETGKKRHRLIGDVFDTYWIVEYDGALYIIDQHAAHEKVLYEKLLKQYRNQTVTSQMLMPPAVLTVTDREGILLRDHMEEFEKTGYEIEEFGGNEISVHAVPDILPSVLKGDLLKEMIGSLSEETESRIPEMILERTATMACKAAVKGGIAISREEADILIDELLHLENPYNCPHGRPTIIRITKSDMEKKFKRVL